MEPLSEQYRKFSMPRVPDFFAIHPTAPSALSSKDEGTFAPVHTNIHAPVNTNDVTNCLASDAADACSLLL